MRNRKKDQVSESDDPHSSENNGSHLDKSNRPHSVEPSDSDSDNENVATVNDNSKNIFSSEPSRTTQVETVRQDKSVLVQSIFNFEDLTSDDEIYTLQCPSMYKKQDLFDRSIDLTKPNQTITAETEEFQFELINSERKFITLAVPRKSGSGALINVPLKGHIIMQKVVNLPSGDLIIEDVCNNSKVVFPQDIKVRHPLLGVNWQDHIKIANKAIKKSNNKKNKNIKKEVAPEIEEDLKTLKRKTCKDEPSTPKKRKKI